MPGKSASKSGGKSAKVVRAEKRSPAALQEVVRKMELGYPGAPEFVSFQKVLGNGSFLIRNARGVEYRGVGGHGSDK